MTEDDTVVRTLPNPKSNYSNNQPTQQIRNSDMKTKLYVSAKRLEESGDIHPNPGPVPNTKKVKAIRSRINLIRTILILVIIINKINNWKEETKVQP